MKSLKTTTIAGGIATGGDSEQIADRNPKRDLLMLSNPEGQEGHLYYEFGAPAEVGATMSLAPGQWVKFDQPGAVPTDAIHVTAADAEHRFVLLLGRRGNVE